MNTQTVLDNMTFKGENKKKLYKVKARLEVQYLIWAEDEEEAKDDAMGSLLEKIDVKNVAYDELKARIIK